MISPVRKRASSNARKTATEAISPGWPARRNGVCTTRSLFHFRAYESARPGAFRHDKAGADGVDADAARTKFLGIGLG